MQSPSHIVSKPSNVSYGVCASFLEGLLLFVKAEKKDHFHSLFSVFTCKMNKWFLTTVFEYLGNLHILFLLYVYFLVINSKN